MAEPKEKAVVGINPAALKAMLDDLATTQAMIQAELPKLRVAFALATLDTTPVDRLIAVGRWIQGELPTLRRRQAYAAQLDQINLQTGTQLGFIHTEWAGNFPNADAAIARAKELAGQYKDGQLPSEVWEEVRQNQDDADFAAAFAKTLGAEKAGKVIYRFAVQQKTGKFGPTEEAQRTALASLLATASRRGAVDETWFEKSSAQGGVLDLMDTGWWDSRLLLKAANYVFHVSTPDSGLSVKTSHVLAGLARDPMSANRVYSENYDQIQKVIGGEAEHWPPGGVSEIGESLAAFIRAATVDARHVYDAANPHKSGSWENPAEDLTRRMVLDLQKRGTDKETGAYPQPVWAEVQSAYAAILCEYYDDLEAATSAPPIPSYYDQADPNRRGIELPENAWAALVQAALWDPQTAATVTAFLAGRTAQRVDALAGTVYKSAPNATSLSEFQVGYTAGWYKKQLDIVIKKSDKNVDDYNAELSKALDQILDPTKAALLAAKGGWLAAATAASKVLKGMAEAQGVAGVKSRLLAWLAETPPDYSKATAGAGWGAKAAQWRNWAVQSQNRDAIDPVKDRAGRIWTGDPAYYEKLYGATFTDLDGHPVNSDEELARLSPTAKRAYTAWLLDPAVQQRIGGSVQHQLLGEEVASSSGR